MSLHQKGRLFYQAPVIACCEVHAHLAFRFMEAGLYDVHHIRTCFRDSLCLVCGNLIAGEAGDVYTTQKERDGGTK